MLVSGSQQQCSDELCIIMSARGVGTWGSRRAGWPILTTDSLGSALASRSTKLSTATLEAAHASTCTQYGINWVAWTVGRKQKTGLYVTKALGEVAAQGSRHVPRAGQCITTVRLQSLLSIILPFRSSVLPVRAGWTHLGATDTGKALEARHENRSM